MGDNATIKTNTDQDVYHRKDRGKNFKKTIVILLMIILTLVLVVTLSMKLRKVFFFEDYYRELAAELLEEKYGEEFIVFDVFVETGYAVTAICAPKSNPEVVFESMVFSKEETLYRENYLREYLAKQIGNEIQEKLQEQFPGCYVHSQFSTEFNYGHDYYEGCTVDEYYEMVDRENLFTEIYIPIDCLNDTNMRQEYDVLSCIYDGMNEKLRESASCSVYFSDGDLMILCESYYSENSERRGILSDATMFCPRWGYGLNDGVSNADYDSYVKEREELSNE